MANRLTYLGNYLIEGTKPSITVSTGFTTVNWGYSPGWNSGLTNVVDRSVNGISVTNSTVTYDSGTPFSGTNRGSMSFGGSTDNINAYNSQFTFGTGDFTIQGWFNFTSFGTYAGLFEGAVNGGGRTDSMVWLIDSSGILRIFQNGSWQMIGTNAVPTSTWVNLALVRLAGVTSCYVDGTLEATTSASMNITTDFCKLGCLGDVQDGFTGLAANYITIKEALYDGNFTPNDVNEELQMTTAETFYNLGTTYGVYSL